MDYPKRTAYFANRFCRLLTKTAAAQELGSEVCWMLTVIAHQEDSKRYSGAVTYYNEQLMPLCGFGGRSRLVRARKSAVDAGWLHYEPGGKRRPGKYWVVIPEQYSALPDGPTDENPAEYRPELGRKEITETPEQGKCRPELGRLPGRQLDGKRAQTGTTNLHLSNLVPKPIPKEPERANGVPNGESPPSGFRSSGVFENVVLETLRDDQKLIAWFQDAIQKKRPVLENTEPDLLFCFAAAEHAIRCGKTPVKLFAWIVGKNNREFVTEADDEKGRRRISALQAGILRERTGKTFEEELAADENNDRQTQSEDLERRWKKNRKQ